MKKKDSKLPNKTQDKSSDLNLSPVAYVCSERGVVSFNVYRNLGEVRSYLSIPSVFRSKNYPWELLTGD